MVVYTFEARCWHFTVLSGLGALPPSCGIYTELQIHVEGQNFCGTILIVGFHCTRDTKRRTNDFRDVLQMNIPWLSPYNGKKHDSIMYSQAWSSSAIECRTSQCCGEHRQTWRKLRWLRLGALARRWRKKHLQTLKQSTQLMWTLSGKNVHCGPHLCGFVKAQKRLWAVAWCAPSDLRERRRRTERANLNTWLSVIHVLIIMMEKKNYTNVSK